VSSHLYGLVLGLAVIRLATQYPDVIDEIILLLKSPIQAQTHLGWEQVYHGQFSHTWVASIDELHPHQQQTSDQIMITLTKVIWTYILNIWKLRNTHHHTTKDQHDLPNYKQVVETLYKQCHLLPLLAQEALYQQPLEAVLDKPAPQLQTWVT